MTCYLVFKIIIEEILTIARTQYNFELLGQINKLLKGKQMIPTYIIIILTLKV